MEPAQHAHGGDAPAGGSLAEVEGAEAPLPQRRVPGLGPGPALVEDVKVEEELDLRLALVAGQLGQAVDEGGVVEGSGSGVEHETSGACCLTVTRTFRASGGPLAPTPAPLQKGAADFAFGCAERLAAAKHGALARGSEEA
ncbi:hypothetical protein [Anaeromyxobacter diazotrophicus]|uniref:Uncharacterized protein n=1 Tax=Anaeromyxobacter diazotrophicus TaxID=2590199 RepID=A0A7I9VL24_9BACT|nr:hypothetical protein AMYX_16290 [Anaeromyxobacter diazotrophicus]